MIFSPNRLASLGTALAAFTFTACKERQAASAPESSRTEVGREETLSENTSSDPWKEIDDPGADGWDSEAFTERASAHLKVLGGLFFQEGDPSPLFAGDFNCDELIPAKQEPVFIDDLVSVERLGRTGEGGSLAKDFSAIRTQLAGDPATRHFQFKIIRVRSESIMKETEQLFSLTYRTTESTVEIHARWVVGWSEEGGALKIATIRVSDFERTTTLRATPLFSDVTRAVIGSNDCHATQLSHGMNHWLQRLPVRAMLNRFGTPGLAVGDINGDGLDDLYLCQEPGLPNLLFLQSGDGTAREVAAEWGVDWIDDSRSALFLDLDNDGDQDLVVAVFGAIVIARNDDGKGFQVETALPTSGSTASLSAADYDNDGLLDLHVCAYVDNDNGSAIGASGGGFVYHDAENGAPNSLFRNLGGLRFVEVTEAVGLTINNRRWSFSSSWEDFDNDGDQDLYVANDYGRNNLYRNDGGRFSDIAAEAGVEDSASGMASSWGDYDRDGLMDLHVSNMFSAAGNRVVTQEKFETGDDPKLRSRFLRFAQGNSLFRNLGEGHFADTGVEAGITLGRWAWGSGFVDLDNDAWQDLVVANGYLSSDGDTGDL